FTSAQANHLNVSGGLGGNNSGNNGAAGTAFVIPTPGLSLSPPSVSLNINRGDTIPAQSFTLQNNSTAPSTLRYAVLPDPSVPAFTATPATGTLAQGQSQVISVSLDARTYGGGTYSFPVVVREQD